MLRVQRDAGSGEPNAFGGVMLDEPGKTGADAFLPLTSVGFREVRLKGKLLAPFFCVSQDRVAAPFRSGQRIAPPPQAHAAQNFRHFGI